MLKDKGGQFYIVAAIIIIAAIISIATVANYAYSRNEPQDFYSIGEIFELNGLKTLENAQFSGKNVNDATLEYLTYFKEYLQANTNIDFDLIIVYGNIDSNSVQAVHYSRESLGDLTANLGGPINIPGGDRINVSEYKITLNSGTDNTIDLTLGEKEIKNIKLIDDKNFIFIMSTNEDFNKYVMSNIERLN